jgi:hypothetical protein
MGLRPLPPDGSAGKSTKESKNGGAADVAMVMPGSGEEPSPPAPGGPPAKIRPGTAALAQESLQAKPTPAPPSRTHLRRSQRRPRLRWRRPAARREARELLHLDPPGSGAQSCGGRHDGEWAGSSLLPARRRASHWFARGGARSGTSPRSSTTRCSDLNPASRAATLNNQQHYFK